MPTLQMSDGCSIFYQVDGDEKNKLLIFSNPHGFDHRLWDPQVKALQSRYRILRYDFRGHGGSDVWTGDYSLERAVRDVIELLAKVGKAPAAFCGLSIGGMVGVWLAASRSDLLEAVVLANTSLYLDPADHLKRRLELIKQTGMDAAVGAIISRSLSETYREELLA